MEVKVEEEEEVYVEEEVQGGKVGGVVGGGTMGAPVTRPLHGARAAAPRAGRAQPGHALARIIQAPPVRCRLHLRPPCFFLFQVSRMAGQLARLE